MNKLGIATLIVLIITALGINHKICNDIKWQREADQEWSNLLDPLYTPKEAQKVYKLNTWCDFILKQVKHCK